jgi:6-phosphogluconolactonase
MHHASRKLLRTIFVAVTALSGAQAVPAVAAAHARARGYVYVNDNTAGRNTVAGFARRADGTLRPLRGSPFDAGGAGTGSGLASQGAIQVTGDGRYVLAVDAGSDQVSVLRIEHDGALKLVRHGVALSRGSQPVSIAEHRGLVYVANAGAGGSDYTGFRLNARGRLRPLRHSTIPLPDDAQPGDVLFDPVGRHLVGIRVNTSQIDSFHVGHDGRLTAAPDSPFAAQAAGPFGSEFRPTDPHQLFVANAHAGPSN